MSSLSLAGSAALESALGGLQRSGAAVNQAAGEVAAATADAVGATGGASTADTVSVSDAATRARSERSMENGLVSARSAGLLYTANAEVVSTVSETERTLIDTYA